MMPIAFLCNNAKQKMLLRKDGCTGWRSERRLQYEKASKRNCDERTNNNNNNLAKQQQTSLFLPSTGQAKPVRDSPELFAACFRCGASNPLLSPFTTMSAASLAGTVRTSPSFSSGGRSRRHDPPVLPWGDACTTCRHPFVRSFFNFESLPLVEFQPDPGCDKLAICGESILVHDAAPEQVVGMIEAK